jgi:hypothetical protein
MTQRAVAVVAATSRPRRPAAESPTAAITADCWDGLLPASTGVRNIVTMATAWESPSIQPARATLKPSSIRISGSQVRAT